MQTKINNPSKKIIITWGTTRWYRIRVLQGIARYGRYAFGSVFRRMSGGMTTVGGHSLAVRRTVLVAKSGMTFPQDKMRPGRCWAGGSIQFICQRSWRLHRRLAHGHSWKKRDILQKINKKDNKKFEQFFKFQFN